MMEVRFTQLYNRSLQFLNIDIPHGSVATRLRSGEIFALPDVYCYNSVGERILKIS